MVSLLFLVFGDSVNRRGCGVVMEAFLNIITIDDGGVASFTSAMKQFVV